jgi:integrase
MSAGMSKAKSASTRFRPKKTSYVGVYTIEGTSPATGRAEKIFYVSYYRSGKRHYEKAGRQSSDGMTARIASGIRSARMRGLEPSNRERREEERAARGRMTISKLWTEYETHRTRRKSIKADRQRYKKFILPALGDKIPEEVDPLSLDRFRAKLAKTIGERSKKPLSPTTVHHVMALLRQIVSFGVQRHLTEGFKCKVPVPPMPQNMRTEFLTPEQAAALIKALDEDPDQDAADAHRLALFTGARKMEILRLRWDDVDLARGVWMLRDRKDDRDTGFPLAKPVRDVLAHRFRTRREDSPFVFPGSAEEGHQKQFRVATPRIRKAAGLPKKFRLFQGLRHHYASAMTSAGVDLYVVSKLLGHSDVTLTSKRYAYLRPGVLAEAAELAGRVVVGETKSGGGT